MTIKAIKTELNDVYLIQEERFCDERGFFVEAFNLKKFKDLTGFDGDFVQDNHSKSHMNVVRGLHYQIKYPQGKLVRCILGSITDVVVDLRRNSSTFGKSLMVQLPSSDNTQLWIPPGFAHGFYVLSQHAEVMYKTTDYYYPEYERTLLWNDPALNLTWNSHNPIISSKDALGKTLEECEKYE